MRYRIKLTGIIIAEGDSEEEARLNAMQKISLLDKSAEVLGPVENQSLAPNKSHMGINQRFG